MRHQSSPTCFKNRLRGGIRGSCSKCLWHLFVLQKKPPQCTHLICIISLRLFMVSLCSSLCLGTWESRNCSSGGFSRGRECFVCVCTSVRSGEMLLIDRPCVLEGLHLHLIFLPICVPAFNILPMASGWCEVYELFAFVTSRVSGKAAHFSSPLKIHCLSLLSAQSFMS